MQLKSEKGLGSERMNRMKTSFHLARAIAVLAAAAAFSTPLTAQDVPEVISPLRVETDHNNVNIVSGQTQLPLPVLSVPAAPNLRFDRVQNAAPYVSGKQWGAAGDVVQSSYSVHTGTGTSESFLCQDFDCTSVTGTGSTLARNALVYHQAGSGARYNFNLKHVKTTGTNPVTIRYYASQVTYPNGETLTYTYDTATIPGDTFARIFYRPTRVTSNLGFFISISYYSSDFNNPAWEAPAEVALYKSSAPTTQLGRLTYNANATTITDIGGRVYVCQTCANSLGSNVERSSGTLQLPGETSPTLQVTSLPSTPLVGAVTKDGVQWSYAYANVRNGASLSTYLYDRVTVTGPGGYNTIYDIRTEGSRNVMWRITDSMGRATAVN